MQPDAVTRETRRERRKLVQTLARGAESLRTLRRAGTGENGETRVFRIYDKTQLARGARHLPCIGLRRQRDENYAPGREPEFRRAAILGREDKARELRGVETGVGNAKPRQPPIADHSGADERTRLGRRLLITMRRSVQARLTEDKIGAELGGKRTHAPAREGRLGAQANEGARQGHRCFRRLGDIELNGDIARALGDKANLSLANLETNVGYDIIEARLAVIDEKKEFRRQRPQRRVAREGSHQRLNQAVGLARQGRGEDIQRGLHAHVRRGEPRASETHERRGVAFLGQPAKLQLRSLRKIDTAIAAIARDSEISSACASVSLDPRILGRINRPSPLSIGCRAPGHQPLMSGASDARGQTSAMCVIERLMGKMGAVAPAAPKPARQRFVEDAFYGLKRARIFALEKCEDLGVAERRPMREIELRIADQTPERREGVKIVDRFGDLRRAAMPVPHLPGKPARIGEPTAHNAGDLALQAAGARPRRIGEVEMRQRRRPPERAIGGAKAPFELREGGTREKIRLRHVLHVHKRVGPGDARGENLARGMAFALSVVSEARRVEKGRAKLLPLLPSPRCRVSLNPRP